VSCKVITGGSSISAQTPAGFYASCNSNFGGICISTDQTPADFTSLKSSLFVVTMYIDIILVLINATI
jgi:exo-beta-1,3-glucanase (GH17 family)